MVGCGPELDDDDEQDPHPIQRGRAMLRGAAQHLDGVARPPLHLPTAARNAVIASLLRAGLLEEVAPAEAEVPASLRITPEGLAAIGREPARVAREIVPSEAEGGVTAPPARLP